VILNAEHILTTRWYGCNG